MRKKQIAERYARAIYDLSVEKGDRDKVFDELRILRDALVQHPDIAAFIDNPLISGRTLKAALEKAISPKSISAEVYNFVMLLAEKERISCFGEIVDAFQEQNDLAHGVVRGRVESATGLAPDERQRIEDIVKKVTKKDVILSYEINAKIIGGLVATVGSFTFDDSIQSHLSRMKEDLKRSQTI